jgi:hypothetical protein
MTDYAKLGTVVLLQRHTRSSQPSAPPLRVRSNVHTTGWTTPTVIYDKMRAIESGARELNALMFANVRKPLLLAAWGAWFARWSAFFAKYQSEWASARWGVLFYTDDLSRQTEGYRSEFASFVATYAEERDAKGEPLPPPSTPVPAVLPDPADRKPPPDEGDKEGIDWWSKLGIKVPWWVWVLGGVAAVGTGYYVYRVIQAGRRTVADTGAKKRALEGLLPKMLGPDLGHAAQAHAQDPGGKALAPSDLFVGPAPEPASHVRHVQERTHHRDPSFSEAAASAEEED